MKTANQIRELLPAIIIIIACYLRLLIEAWGLGATLPSAVGNELAPKGARTFLSAQQWLDLILKFPSSASMSAIPKYECEDECGFWHSFRTTPGQEGDYKDHILPYHSAFVPYHDHT